LDTDSDPLGTERSHPVEYTAESAPWRAVLRRAVGVFVPGRGGRPRSGWSIGVPLIALVAGLLFTTTATTAGGTSLREDRRPRLAQVVNEKREQVAESQERANELAAAVEAETDALAGSDRPIAEQRDRARASAAAAGFTEVHGPGLTIRLDDAPQRPGSRPAGVRSDDLVVHQGDVQAVVNALWAGGAEAMSIMDVRVLSTSAVRCVGNTLLLHGRVYSPPYKIIAIGDPLSMRRALAASPGVRDYKDAVVNFELGYQETVEQDVTVPAFDGSSALRSARVAP
jgi:uncharacterized protein YlxW (UPF0749 family)